MDDDSAAATLEARIREVVAAAPPLTDEQIGRLRLLFGTTAPSEGATDTP